MKLSRSGRVSAWARYCLTVTSFVSRRAEASRKRSRTANRRFGRRFPAPVPHFPEYRRQRFLRFRMAGFSKTVPSRSNRDPWQAQSQLCSVLFQCSAQPRWVHRGEAGRRRFPAASSPLIRSCFLKMLREGANAGANSQGLPRISQVSRRAATMEAVIPHALNPAATRVSGVREPYGPI